MALLFPIFAPLILPSFMGFTRRIVEFAAGFAGCFLRFTRDLVGFPARFVSGGIAILFLSPALRLAFTLAWTAGA